MCGFAIHIAIVMNCIKQDFIALLAIAVVLALGWSGRRWRGWIFFRVGHGRSSSSGLNDSSGHGCGRSRDGMSNGRCGSFIRHRSRFCGGCWFGLLMKTRHPFRRG